MLSQIRCTHCGCLVPANTRCKNQEYCGKKECQRARKRKWQKQKMETDDDYRENQRDCQRQWREKHPDYWREYRKNNQRYRERNKIQQKVRDQKRRLCLAKMDALTLETNTLSGRYYIVPLLGKMDALEVDIVPITTC